MSLSLDNTMRWFVQADQLERDGFRTVGELEEYAENTASSLYYLMLECLGENCAPKNETQRGTCKGQQTYTGKTDIHETLFMQKCAQSYTETDIHETLFMQKCAQSYTETDIHETLFMQKCA